MIIEKSDGPPRPNISLEDELYQKLAADMEINDKVKTINKSNTASLLRALERLQRKGTQRKIDGELWVWRNI